MILLLSIHRSPDRCETGRGFSGKWLIAGSSEKSLTRPLPLANHQPRSSGVLERSDRVTGCFDGGQGWQSGYTPINRSVPKLAALAPVPLQSSLRTQTEKNPRKDPRLSVDLGPCKARREKASTNLGFPTREGPEIYLEYRMQWHDKQSLPESSGTDSRAKGCEQIVRRKTLIIPVHSLTGGGKRPSVARILLTGSEK